MRHIAPYHYQGKFHCNTIHFRGTVVSAQKNRLIHTCPVTGHSETRVHHEFFLHDPESGKETAIELENWDVSLRAGHNVAVAWITDGSEERLIAVYNYSLGEETWDEDALPAAFHSTPARTLTALGTLLWFCWLLFGIAIALKFALWRPVAALIIILGSFIAVAMLYNFINGIFRREREKQNAEARADLRRTVRHRADTARYNEP